MDDDSPSPPPSQSPRAEQVARDNARIGYQQAISLAISEGGNVWTRYGLMLLIQTIFLSVLGLTSNVPQPGKNLIWIGLSSVGLVLCFQWWVVNDVGFRYFFYWMFSARELEERYLGPVQAVARAFPVAGEGEVSVVVGGKRLPLPIFEQDRLRVVRASKLIIVIVGLLYGSVLLGLLIQLRR